MKRGFWIIAVALLIAFSGCLSAPMDSEPVPSIAPTEAPPTCPVTITENELGTVDGYDYELWKDHGTTDMTLTGGGTFTCNWSDINNALFRIGKKFDCTQTWEEIGTITFDYGAEYFPVGNSYLCIYGWTRGLDAGAAGGILCGSKLGQLASAGGHGHCNGRDRRCHL